MLVYGIVTDLPLGKVITDAKSERKEFMALMDGTFEPSGTRSSSMDMESVRAISPLNTHRQRMQYQKYIFRIQPRWLVLLQAAHGNYIDSLEIESDIEIADSWYEGHDG